MTSRLLTALVTAALMLTACGSSEGGSEDPTEAQGTTASSPSEAADGTRAWGQNVPALHPTIDGYDEVVVTLAAPEGTAAGGGDAGAVTANVLPVKIARTGDEHQHGLMEVTDLPDGTGMLFEFDDDRTGGFWMKNTLVPLDIAFIADDGTIVSIFQMEPCAADPCTIYTPTGPYRRALEVAQGWFERAGVTDAWTLTNVEDA